jgi:hypothetical protein
MELDGGLVLVVDESWNRSRREGEVPYRLQLSSSTALIECFIRDQKKCVLFLVVTST